MKATEFILAIALFWALYKLLSLEANRDETNSHFIETVDSLNLEILNAKQKSMHWEAKYDSLIGLQRSPQIIYQTVKSKRDESFNDLHRFTPDEHLRHITTWLPTEDSIRNRYRDSIPSFPSEDNQLR